MHNIFKLISHLIFLFSSFFISLSSTPPCVLCLYPIPPSILYSFPHLSSPCPLRFASEIIETIIAKLSAFIPDPRLRARAHLSPHVAKAMVDHCPIDYAVVAGVQTGLLQAGAGATQYALRLLLVCGSVA